MATITKTIGTSSRDYSTITAWEADLDNGAVYASGDGAVGECYNDSTFVEAGQVTLNGGGTVGLASITLTAASSERHDGTAGTGVKLNWTGASFLTTPLQLGDNRVYVAEWLEVTYSRATLGVMIQFSGFNAGNAGSTVRNCIVHGGSTSGFNQSVVIGISSLQGSVDHRILNNIIYRIQHNFSGSANGAIGIIGSPSRSIYNNTLYAIQANNGSGAARGILTNGFTAPTIKNNLVSDTGGTSSGAKTDYSDGATNPGSYSNNASSDGTALGAFGGDPISSSIEFVSTVGGSEDLHLKAGAECIDAGTDLGTSPTGVNIDIDGRDRDAQNDTWDIGADEFVTSFNLQWLLAQRYKKRRRKFVNQ